VFLRGWRSRRLAGELASECTDGLLSLSPETLLNQYADPVLATYTRGRSADEFEVEIVARLTNGSQTEVEVTVTDLPGRRWLTGDGFVKAEDGTVESRVVSMYFGRPPQGLSRPTS